MKLQFLLVLFLCTGFLLQASPRRHSRKHKNETNIISVTMQRTGCYGRCEVYSVELTNNGIAYYNGIKFTKDTGLYRKDIGKEKTMKIISELELFCADTCKERYTNRIADLPGILYTIVYKTKTIHISNAHFGPYFLKDIATHIDDAAQKTNDEGWVKVNYPDEK